MGAADIVALIYFAGVVIFAVITWIENGRVYYHNGPPSGCATGFFWPVILLAVLVFWFIDPMRKA